MALFSSFGVTFLGTRGADEIDGDDFGNLIFGFRGDDLLFGNGGEDRIIAGRGDDTASGGDDDDFISGGFGADLLFGDAGEDLLLGGFGADTIDGGDGADVVRGGFGSDLLISEGADDLSGGRGFDTADFSAASDGVFVDLEAGLTDEITVLNDGSVDLPEFGAPTTPFVLETGVSRISNQVVNVTGAAPATPDVDVITFTVPEGTELSQLILTEFVSADDLGFIAIQDGAEFTVNLFDPAGVDVGSLLGGANFGVGETNNALAGTDILSALGAGGGLDGLDGVIGFDGPLPAGTYTILVQQIGGLTIDFTLDFVVTALDDPTDGFGTISSVEAIVGSDAVDVLNGGDAADVINGAAGADVINGGAGADSVSGGDGDDLIFSDATDAVDGGAGVDTIDFSFEEEGVVIDLDINSAGASGTPSEDGAVLSAIGGEVLATVTDVENATGTNADDILFGNNEVNALLGLDGDDAIHSFGGADTLNGGAGVDTALFTAGGGVVVDLDDAGNAASSAGDTLLSIENLTGSGVGDDALSGNAGDNVLIGNGGNDTLDGEDGNDTIDGGAGDDVIVTGGGVDVVELGVVGEGESGADVVTDFDLNNFDPSVDGIETSFDTVTFEFGGESFTLASGQDFLDFTAFIESDGDGSTDALLDGDDLVFDFGNGDTVRFEGIVETDGLTVELLGAAGVDLFPADGLVS